MTAVNITDVDAVLAIYNSLVELHLNWLLLKYDDNSDEFYLHASGSKGLPELKQSFEESSTVHIAFYNEESSQVQSRPGFALINYIPSSISGIRRARALVQSRRIGALFVKTEYATLTIDHLSNLTPSAIHQAVLHPDGIHNIRIERSASSPEPVDPQSTLESMIFPIRRSFTENRDPSVIPLNYSTPPKSQSLFSSILRRKRATPSTDVPWDSDEDVAPPTPPKDNNSVSRSNFTYTPGARLRSIPNSDLRKSLAEFAFISHPIPSSDDEVIVEHPNPPPKTLQPLSSNKPDGALFSIPLDRKWVHDTVYISDPEERARRRKLVQQQRALEEQQALQQEAERQARIKEEKEELKRQEEEEEAWRKSMLEQELQEIKARRRAREQREQEEDARKKREIEARKEMDRKRRMEEHEKLEEWRQQMAWEVEAEKMKEEDDRRRADAERKTKVQNMVKEVKMELRSSGWTTAWATLQTGDSLVWRRRYLKLVGSKIFIYRSPKDMNQTLDEVELRGQIVGLREPNEGFEELKAIKHSFAIVFKDGRDPWAVFGDTEEEKIKMLGMLQYAAGL
ncbi:enoyl- hydratase carnithine racemase [Lentinula edodes]|uniref:Enoyl-hydratase carnithine racemase n=1 Tax=Lentinula edodes TaxID=5353 RepID=A0A1Q3ES16_LENED|nr:uncharacterized protein C8R40DRAFT_1142131 [Lentinula edodes]KAH7879105.1 hypothetical protein C8R40DRAFT_1142131 [Lentinula edodes]GAW09985.1 enoyl- hydratase carnithine racemase [Lentinula edodes]